jgi:2-polyprenyl-3-methyl-5-hydroxy-6-metoxy-1,4-benzoquinol methylase
MLVNPTSLNPGIIFRALNAFRQTGILKTGIDLGVFTAIADGATTAADLGLRCGASERGIRVLCDNLTIAGFLTKSEGKYANSEEAAIFLNSHSPAYMGGVTGFLCSPEMVTEMISNFTDAVRKGGTMMAGEGTVSDANPVWVTFARTMAPMMMPAAHAIAEQVPAAGPMKVLDIAAGHGMFGVTIAQRNADAEIVALDWAAVLEVAKENAVKAGVESRYSTIAGSAFDVDYGEGYDVVLITNFIHHFDPPTNEAFLRKAHAALKPGGRAITLEFVPNEDRVSPAGAASFSVIMLSGTEHGDAYTFSELDSMFRNAGFAGSSCHLLPTDQSIVISTKAV